MRIMPERSFATESWTESQWFQGLTRDQRYLFLYLCTNQHCKQAGLYYITLPTMAFETKFIEMELPDILTALTPKVEWYPEKNLVWVKNFIKRQSKSPKFLIAVAKCLEGIKDRDKDIIKELIEYNYTIHSISIPYGNSIGIAPIPTIPIPIPSTKPISNIGELIRQVWAGLSKRRDYPSPDKGKEAQAIKWMLEQAYTPDQILDVYDKMAKDTFWVDKHLDMQSVKKQIGAILKNGTHKGNNQKAIKHQSDVRILR